MAIVTRWVLLGCMLSAPLVAACGSNSKCEPAAPCSGVGGGAGASNDSQAGASSAGSSGASSAGAGHANSGAAGASPGGTGGTSSGGGTSSAGAAGKASGNAGASSGGAGGSQGGGSCGGAQVVFLIQRSGALFNQPAMQVEGGTVPPPLEASYFAFLQAALVGDGGVAKPYSGKLPIGVSFLFATRDAVNALPAICPQLVTADPNLSFDDLLATAFAQSAADHAALVTAKLKEEAPVPEGIESVLAAWPGASGKRHLVLITTALPDTCTQFDGPCGLDATVKAVQDARVAGVTTHVIGLGHDPMFNYGDAEGMLVQTGNEEYLQQLANAGLGKPLGPPNVQKLQDHACSSATPAVLTASYTATPGDAKYYQVMTATDAKTAVAEVLASVCP